MRHIVPTMALVLLYAAIAAAQVPSSTPARPTDAAVQSTTPAASTTAPAASETTMEPTVIQARTEDIHYSESKPTYASLGQLIVIDVYNLNQWLADPALARKNGNRTPEIRDLVPFLNGMPLHGIQPETYEWEPADDGGRIYHLKYVLSRTDSTQHSWSRLLNEPVLNRQVGVSVGIPDVDEMPTNVHYDSPGKSSQFFLVVIPPRWLLIGTLILVLSLAIFLWLSSETDIIRDPNAAPRPDGLQPYSLARAQMAFWFFLVISSYFFLWVITGDRNTITSSVLGLIGISAGTALGAAIVDAGKGSGATRIDIPGTASDSTPHQVESALREAETQLAKEADDLQAKIIVTTDPAAADPLRANLDRVTKRLTAIREYRRYIRFRPWQRLAYDFLGDANVISFHRFQICVWTIVLGIIFCTSVYKDLAMPEFSGTLLGLLGISAGTYIGFKLPENRTT